jgi:glycerol-3-phosphate dehydrogenase (NAD(P)+)
MTRLGVALGAKPETFMGLAGAGDLILTATGDLSRTRRVGLGLAGGKALAQILAELGHVAEGVTSCTSILELASSYDVEMPLTDAVHRVCHRGLSVDEAVALLLGRSTKAE